MAPQRAAKPAGPVRHGNGNRRAPQSSRSNASTRSGTTQASRLDVAKIIAAVQRKKEPKKKKSPASARTSGTSYLGSALSVFSPSSPHLVPTLTASGKSFPVTGMYRKTAEFPSTQRRIYMFSNTGQSSNVMLIGAMDTVGDGLPGWETFGAPTVMGSHGSGLGPTSGRAMKMGATIVNATPKLTAGGRVFVLNCDQRLFLGSAPTAMSRVYFSGLCDSVVNHPRVREFSGSDFSKPHSWHSHVVDPVHYEKFTSWDGLTGINEYAESFATWNGDSTEDRSMSTICIVFEPPPTQQSYTISGRASWYTRWPLNSVLGQTNNEIPIATQADLNRHYAKAAESSAGPSFETYW